ncbi:hypothetical protein J6590_024983 [Homalodisca vitripennis]|nr:hypothetical protein J6590_024983 [Homalodisca vitripennis]
MHRIRVPSTCDEYENHNHTTTCENTSTVSRLPAETVLCTCNCAPPRHTKRGTTIFNLQ